MQRRYGARNDTLILPNAPRRVREQSTHARGVDRVQVAQQLERAAVRSDEERHDRRAHVHNAVPSVCEEQVDRDGRADGDLQQLGHDRDARTQTGVAAEIDVVCVRGDKVDGRNVRLTGSKGLLRRFRPNCAKVAECAARCERVARGRDGRRGPGVEEDVLAHGSREAQLPRLQRDGRRTQAGRRDAFEVAVEPRQHLQLNRRDGTGRSGDSRRSILSNWFRPDYQGRPERLARGG
eukprot:6202012-Pleurochrysis_carterae.AAC.1